MHKIELAKGKVLKVIDRHFCQVKLEDGAVVLTSISSKMRLYLNKPDLAEGDIVMIQFSPYDRFRGRIHRSTFLL